MLMVPFGLLVFMVGLSESRAASPAALMVVGICVAGHQTANEQRLGHAYRIRCPIRLVPESGREDLGRPF